jgi:hypothetical protein
MWMLGTTRKVRMTLRGKVLMLQAIHSATRWSIANRAVRMLGAIHFVTR